MKRLFLDSLQRQLVLLVVVALAPTLVLITSGYLQQRDRALDRIRAESLWVSRNVAQEQAQLVERARQLLTVAADFSDVRTGSAASCSSRLTSLFQNLSGYTNLAVVDAKGQLFCSAVPFNRPISVADRAWFQQVYRTNQPVIDGFSSGRVSGQPTQIIAIPLDNRDGQLTRVLLAGIRLDWMRQLVQQTRLPAGAALTLIDPRGLVLSRVPEQPGLLGDITPDLTALQSQQADPAGSVFEAVGSDGSPHLFAVMPLSRTADNPPYAYSYVSIPARLVFAEADAALLRNLTLLSLVMLAVLGLAWLALRRLVVHPVGALVALTGQLAAGREQARSGLTSYRGELGRLAQAIDQLAEALEQRCSALRRAQDELEERVALRTRSLSSLNGQLAHELNERRVIERALRESEARYRTICDLTSDYVYCLRVDETDGLTREWQTGALARISGYSQAELSRMHWLDMFHPDDRPAIQSILARTLAGEVVVADLRLCTKSGETRWVRDYVRPEIDPATQRVWRICGALQDITTHRQAEASRLLLERRLLETQKFESLSVLAGGVAHDFNNLMSIVLGNAQLAALHTPPDSPAQECLGQITQGVRRAAGLTRQLLAYAGGYQGRHTLLDLNRLISDRCAELAPTLGPGVRLELALLPGLPRIQADAMQIGQLIENLLLNAIEALGSLPGAIVIGTDIRSLSHDDLAATHLAPSLPDGEYVVLHVHDTGSGIDTATRPRIFDPFFTTKFTGRGLGLAAVLGIVQGHKGALQVESALGRGSTFTVFLRHCTATERALAHPPETLQLTAPSCTAVGSNREQRHSQNHR